MSRSRRILASLALAAAFAATGAGTPAAAITANVPGPGTTPIQHVVIIYQENHSFDNVLGQICVQVAAGTLVRPGADDPCNGTATGKLPGGAPIRLAQAKDVVPEEGHAPSQQIKAIDGGKMDGWANIRGCSKSQGYGCLTQFDGSQIPNIWALATHFAISDATFENAIEMSWPAHIEVVSSTNDGFQGDNPSVTSGEPSGPGWGCDSYRTAQWRPTPSVAWQWVPSCIPKKDGSGPFKPSPVPWVPTIMDRLEAAGLSWKLYTVPTSSGAYNWAVCPTFADCIYTSQHSDQVSNSAFNTDAAAGNLPSFSVLLPNGSSSQHNGVSMKKGDNWIGQAVNAIESGPDWDSTAIFITWDDCGCFYDHVPPPGGGLGLRVPMVIVSPYARAGYTDSSTASYSSMLAFTEHTFGLSPLGTADAAAYDYANAFNFSQAPLASVPMHMHPISLAERRFIRMHNRGKGGDT
jgi:phospholipase C